MSQHQQPLGTDDTLGHPLSLSSDTDYHKMTNDDNDNHNIAISPTNNKNKNNNNKSSKKVPTIRFSIDNNSDSDDDDDDEQNIKLHNENNHNNITSSNSLSSTLLINNNNGNNHNRGGSTMRRRTKGGRVVGAIGNFFVNHVLPIDRESDEDRLTMGPIAKMIKYRKLPFKLVLDLIMLLCVILIVCTAANTIIDVLFGSREEKQFFGRQSKLYEKQRY